MPSTADPKPVASRRRLIAARALTVVAVVLVVVSALANFVKREALDESQFRGTSRDLIADKTIRDEVAVTLVDQLYANVDVAALLRRRLPANVQPLSGVIAGVARDASVRSAQRLVEQPQVQDAFVAASSHAQRQFVGVLDGNETIVKTTGGKVVLDVRPLVLDLGDRFSIVSNLQSRLPANAGRVTILESDQLKSAQDATRLLRFVADWIWVFALAAAAGAVWLARGRRRNEVRALAIGLLIAGVVILIARSLIGRYVVGHLVQTESVRPAASAAYGILTDLLRGAGWSAIIVALVALVGIWLSGPRPRATAARHALAPYLRRPESPTGRSSSATCSCSGGGRRRSSASCSPSSSGSCSRSSAWRRYAARRLANSPTPSRGISRRLSAHSSTVWRSVAERTAPRASSSAWQSFAGRACSTRTNSSPPRRGCSARERRDPAVSSRSGSPA